MQTKAYVLIEVDAGQVGTVIGLLREVPGITAVDAVTGPYDIIITIETPDNREVGRLVMHEIHSMPGIERTVTCLSIG